MEPSVTEAGAYFRRASSGAGRDFSGRWWRISWCADRWPGPSSRACYVGTALARREV